MNNTIKENEINYINDINAALLLSSPKRTRQALYLICGFLASLLLWAAFAKVDEVTVGAGKVIPSQQVQVIQNLEGGILKEVFVKEGDIVNPGDKLLSIDETRFLSEFREQQAHAYGLRAEITRLRSELDSLEAVGSQFNIEPVELKFANEKAYPELINRQKALYAERMRNLANQVKILDQQVMQKQQQLTELASKIEHAQRSYQLVSKELDLTRPLANSGVVSEVELIKLERAANDVKGELSSLRLLRPKIKAEVEEMENKRTEVVLKFRSEVQKELAKAENELTPLDEALVSSQDRLTRTNVFSPVRGTIKTININTVGGVIQPGMDLIEIVPLADSLLVEAKILPKDIAFLRPGLPAVIKLTAYDFTIYGGLKGTVEHISADTIQDEKENSFYLIRVRTEDSYLDKNNNPLPIIPGMTASVDVLTGKKTVLDYLLKPIVRAKQNAMRER
ncbi:HlyD family secretion protein [Catenovulum agarivorans DS-2]|uniref:Membrane fusion protein (MFP) family protein n=1 Tax=Catenovulum agarivorans DS-2 TaxID=1328313 RepID=W7QBL8_9ALTE|nr:HlyD family type I secretion periplasmic adaptor subunit [Catenovulum agarivorans]EWH09376.1 HlyD family secretion protein [Catenovulum agarivorans DS-2]